MDLSKRVVLSSDLRDRRRPGKKHASKDPTLAKGKGSRLRSDSRKETQIPLCSVVWPLWCAAGKTLISEYDELSVRMPERDVRNLGILAVGSAFTQIRPKE